MLATYFPKPLNPLMGNWALAQAQALRRNGVDVLVVSLTAWVPEALAQTKGARAYAKSPERYDWDGLPALYPRWLYYPVGPARTINQHYPGVSGAVGWLSARRKLLEVVRKFQPEVIYTHHTAVNGYLATRLKQLTGLPFVVTDHDFGEIESCRSQPARRRVFGQVAREASAMIAVSKRMEREIKEQFPYARTYTIQNGTEPLPRTVVENPRPAELRGQQIVFSCGTFYHRKGFPLLVDAFARIAGKYPKAQLRIAGDGDERMEVERRIRAHGLESRVTLLGSQPHARVLQEMVWADIFALIGWDEPFATVYLEALAAGRPVVCCSDGGITDVVKDGQHGFTVCPRDLDSAAEAIDRLLGGEEMRTRFGAAAVELFEGSLTWDRHAGRMIDIFSEAWQKGSPLRQ
jgi:glycosyltransferase involved in cell wall biosynthesis